MSQRPAALAAAAALQSATGLAALAFGLSIAVETVLGHWSNLATAISASALTAGGGLLILWIARGLWTAQRWSRSPAVLTQLFALPVAVSLIQSDRPWWGYPLITVAILALLTNLSRPVLEALYADDIAEAERAAEEAERAEAEAEAERKAQGKRKKGQNNKKAV
ncbi:hypothetical protein [Actinocorallia sp. A-T 12471]|uniref:hypothetical protein n=1 Tax=Actinocorallia sp. A-T 12471 TaxID=3089813 RepID=UPI0029CE939F|nr:hypothetical protein [Actinocorallia sp. A-T 12471]MDX6738897.1 hypothetical protein [Actinocorallia sp. A-T 12471]